MAYYKRNINIVTQNGLCTGCGVCENACKSNSIHMELRWDGHKPIVDNTKCLADKGCDRCISSCPGIGIDLEEYSNRLFPELDEEYGLGKYYSLYTGYSCDKNIRFHSASGGVVVAFLTYLLDKGFIEGAVVATHQKERPFIAKTIVARKPDEIINAQSSKYCPVSLDGIYDQIVSSNGQFAIVGLPCHIHGFRKLSRKDEEFAAKIFGFLGLFCSSTRTALMPEYLLYKSNLKPCDVSSFAFRGEGNPGNLKIVSKDGKEYKVHFHQYYREIRAFFNFRRCMFCYDGSAELSDISLGDIHIPEFLKDDLGVNSIVVRNRKFDELLKQACCDGYLSVQPVEKEKIIRSQRGMICMKKKRIYSAFFLRKIFLKRVPDFGTGFKGRANLKDIVSVCAGLFQGFIGKRKCFWFMIIYLQRVINNLKKKK